MKKLSLIFIIILSLLPIFADGVEKSKLAVMEFEDLSKKLPAKRLSNATEYIRAALVSSNEFIVIAKERQEKVMIKEMKKESYKVCNDKNCQIPLGQALSADTILRTTINFFGGIYTITSELIDLEKEATVKGASATFDGSEKSLRIAIDNIVEQITGKKPLNSQTTQSNRKTTNHSKLIFNGLQWSNKAHDTKTWNDAANYCENLNEDGYSDWRLPTLNELKTLFGKKNPVSFDAKSKLGDTGYFWSSSHFTSERFWVAIFGWSDAVPDGVDIYHEVRCVRDN